MKRRATGDREALLCRLLEKAEGMGGEEWLRQCLEGENVPASPAPTPSLPMTDSAAPGSGTKKQPLRKKKGKSAAASPQPAGPRKVGRPVTKGAPRKRGCSASPPSAVEASEQSLEDGKGMLPEMSQFAVLVDSLSNVLNQFKGAHASGAGEATQRAQVSGAGNAIQHMLDVSSGAQMNIGAGQSPQLRGKTAKNYQCAQVSGADYGLHSDREVMDNYDIHCTDDISAVWQDWCMPASQDTKKLMSVKGVNHPDMVNPTVPLRLSAATVGESSFKEPLPCVLSPLGFHLSKAVKDKIWKGEFLDLLSLLPASKEFLAKSEKQSGDRTEEDRRRAIPKTFQNWLQAFCIYAAVLGERFPEKCSGLFQHVDIIAEAFRHFGGSAWFVYDENFRQKLAVHPSLNWGSKDVGLWLNLMLPTKPQFAPRPLSNPAQNTLRKGFCFAFNEGQCEYLANCRYRHECSYCNGTHPACRCFRKSSATAHQSVHGKGIDTSEPNKNAPVVRALPRPQEGGSIN